MIYDAEILLMLKRIKGDEMLYPNPNDIHPNINVKQICFIKNVLTNPNIIVGDFSYFDDVDESMNFEKMVTHHYEFIGDKLVIGKFCAIARGVEFIMNGANHPMSSVTAYPFYIMGGEWAQKFPTLDELPLKGDTVIGNDVWIGQNSTIMPGVNIGDGVIIAANSVVTKNVPAYHIVGGNPAKIISQRFDNELIEYLQKLQWWDWTAEKIFQNMDILQSSDIQKIRNISIE